jgi:Sulfotransferase family
LSSGTISANAVPVAEGRPVTSSSKAPVFVVGCVRSGTTWLYHMLLSAGNFAVYRAESNVFNVLEPRAGSLRKPANRQQLLKDWQPTRMFTRTGLDMSAVESRIMQECRNGGDFLRIYMEMMAEQQGVERWAECTPEHILYLDRIQQTIPGARVIHVIRDGRDVALSTEKQKWIKPLPWEKGGELLAAALFWEWMVLRGRRDGKKLGANYCEVRYEDLVLKPHETLAGLSSFVGQELDYDQILKVGLGSVSKPNTSFGHEQRDADFSPIGRWKQSLPEKTAIELEVALGPTLTELGYPLLTEPPKSLERGAIRSRRSLYRAYFESKLFLKSQTPLAPLFVTRDLSWLD